VRLVSTFFVPQILNKDIFHIKGHKRKAMKSKVGLTLALSIALVCITLVAYSGVGFSTFTPHSFTLTVSGGALSPKLTVALTLTGTISGDSKKAFELHVNGGTLTVQNYGTFTIPKGSGIVVLCRHFIDFEIKKSRSK
jgi:hypothetical protein